MIRDMLRDPHALVLDHVQKHEVFQNSGLRLDRAAGLLGYRPEVVRTIPDSNGRPMFEIVQFVPYGLGCPPMRHGCPGNVPFCLKPVSKIHKNGRRRKQLSHALSGINPAFLWGFDMHYITRISDLYACVDATTDQSSLGARPERHPPLAYGEPPRRATHAGRHDPEVDSHRAGQGHRFPLWHPRGTATTPTLPVPGHRELEGPNHCGGSRTGGVAGGIRQSVSGAPELKPGQEYVLFLWTSRSGLTQVIGLSQGLFQLSEEGSEGGVVSL